MTFPENRRTWWLIAAICGLFVLCIPISAALGVRYDYTLITVATGGAALGLVSGVLGTFAVLRRQSLMGDAISHAALPGVAIAFLLFGRDLGWLLVGAAVAGGIANLFIIAVTRTTRIKQDAAMGMALSAFFAIGIALLSYIQGRADASQAGLDKFILGQAAAIVQSDVLLISAVGIVVFVVLGVFWKELKLLTFDAEFAGANGLPVRWLDLMLSMLIVAAIVLGLQVAGVILMVGMLIAPAVAARQWTRQLDQMVILSAVFGAFSGAAGAIASALDAGLPTGPLIIVVASGIVIVSLLFAPERGIVWRWWREREDRTRFAAQNVLEDVYQLAHKHGDLGYRVPEGMLTALRGGLARVGLRELLREGLLEYRDGSYALTAQGMAQVQPHRTPESAVAVGK
jgi:manganese/zinc/iron transport system permease protein